MLFLRGVDSHQFYLGFSGDAGGNFLNFEPSLQS